MKRTAIAGVAIVAVLALALSLGPNRHAARADVDSTSAVSCLFVAELVDGDPLDFVTGNEVSVACDSLTPSEIATIASAVGDQDATLEAGELDTIDVDANQVTDNLAATLPRLTTIYVFAFVDDDGTVTFDADSGVSVSINDDGTVTDPAPADDVNVETCDGDDDADCGTSILGDGDGVVVATITETSANEGDAVDVDITQEGVTQTQTIEVVGAPDDISLSLVEPPTIAPDAQPVCFDGGIEWVVFNIGDPRSTAVDAEVMDSDGRSLSRISVSFNSGNTAVAAIGYTSYLTRNRSTRSSALAIVCGVDPGSTFIEADIGVEQQAVSITVQEPCDPGPCPTATATPVIGCDPESPPCPTATPTPDPNDSPPLCEWPLSPPNCAPDADSDGVPDNAEFWYGTDPNDPDTDDDGFLDRPQLLHLSLNTDTSRDNCPNVFNTPQDNGDGNFINLHPAKAFDDLTAPMSDAAGDACDFDVDNDGLSNDDEVFGEPCGGSLGLTKASDPDSDDDLVLDYAECVLVTDPNNINSVPPAASCASSADNDGDRVSDLREFCYYNTSTSSTDSDNDGCTDAAEIASINGDTKVNSLDLTQVAQNFALTTYTIPAAPHIVQFDINRDRKINSIDLSLIGQNFNAQSCM